MRNITLYKYVELIELTETIDFNKIKKSLNNAARSFVNILTGELDKLDMLLKRKMERLKNINWSKLKGSYKDFVEVENDIKELKDDFKKNKRNLNNIQMHNDLLRLQKKYDGLMGTALFPKNEIIL